jgi:Protein of unknown function (DUF2924)
MSAVDCLQADWTGSDRTTATPRERAPDSKDIALEIAAITRMDTVALRRQWQTAFRSAAPSRIGPEFIRRALAFHLQEQLSGGLSRQARLRLKALERRSASKFGGGALSSPATVKPGTRFLREWQGEMHEVQAIETGDFVYRGRTYASLSVIAREITGTHQSGPRFFGLGRYAAKRSSRVAANG